MSNIKSKSKEEILAHTSFKQVLFTTIITAISTIIITLISTGHFKKEVFEENCNWLAGCCTILWDTAR